MSANIKVSGKVYNGVNTISVKNEDNSSSKFILDSEVNFMRNDVNFYDFDGSIVKSFSAADFAILGSLPANPTHTGLVADGWNWTLADAKAYVAAYGKLNIGQMYHTASGKTEYDVEINEATGMTATLTGTSGTQKDWGDGTIDTEETHTYATAGSYTIKLSGTTLPSIQDSKKVRAVRIASGVTSTSNNIFKGCRELYFITMPNSITNISTNFANECRSLSYVTIPSSVTSIGVNAFQACSNLRGISIPNSVTSFANSVFYLCHSLQSINLPSNITILGNQTARDCSALKSIIIPSGITSIGNYAMSGCSALSYVTIPSGVTNIGKSVFNSSGLMSITLPSSVTSIDTFAFANCTVLTIMTVLATTPPTIEDTGFPPSLTKIYIPHGTLTAYQTATNWSAYSSLFVELPA